MMSLQCLKGWFTLPYWQALAMPLRVVCIALLASSTMPLRKWVRFGYLLLIQKIKATQSGQP